MIKRTRRNFHAENHSKYSYALRDLEVGKQAIYADNSFYLPGRTPGVFVIEKETAPEVIAALLAITGLGFYLRKRNAR